MFQGNSKLNYARPWKWKLLGIISCCNTSIGFIEIPDMVVLSRRRKNLKANEIFGFRTFHIDLVNIKHEIYQKPNFKLNSFEEIKNIPISFWHQHKRKLNGKFEFHFTDTYLSILLSAGWFGTHIAHSLSLSLNYCWKPFELLSSAKFSLRFPGSLEICFDCGIVGLWFEGKQKDPMTGHTPVQYKQKNNFPNL